MMRPNVNWTLAEFTPDFSIFSAPRLPPPQRSPGAGRDPAAPFLENS